MPLGSRAAALAADGSRMTLPFHMVEIAAGPFQITVPAERP
jgi:hypothetical protein